jgi:valyl-tRNA synthetase
MNIEKQYSPNQIEKKWYDFWQKNEYFQAEIDSTKKPYTILIPPPNVTGILHMGHVLNNTLQDVMIRYKRMTGVPTLWIPGVDHAGIATQNVVEKELAKEGKTRHDIGREALLEKVWEWKNEKGDRIIEQLKQLGCSCDWQRSRFTMDETLSKAVKEVFISLYEKGLIYKGKRIINWCPRCVTALANDEVEHEDSNGNLWHIRYPFKNRKGYVVVATTRPETMLGDTAVAVHPHDKRYQDVIGETILLPLTNREIPILADEYVDKDFGSGCVKITPAHDPNDFEVGLRHQLEQVVVMDEHGIMNFAAGKEFEGMERGAARKKVVQMLKELDLLEKVDAHEHAVGHCYRCDTIIEPYLSEQWFVKMQPLAKPAIEVVKNEEVKFQPSRWTKVYFHWMENVRDWCISRQIWWGHRIPAYYCENCNEMIVARETPEKCPSCGHHSFVQDEDVLDTWFSSWLWPFSTLGWPEKTPDLDYFLPTNVLVTESGIIYLWVARMIMSTLEFTGKIPFDTVLIHGKVLDENGIKMSKSLGNSPDPLDIIASVGADALRFSMIFNTPKGQDSYYSDSILETGRNFTNKIWNAFRYIMMNAEQIEELPKKENLKMDLADKWIYSRLHQVIQEVQEHYENLRLNDAARVLMDFVWKEFCSWYIELSKDKIYNESNSEGKQTAVYILLDILQNSMRLLHPIMPFITEEIWQKVKTIFPMAEDALIIAAFPQVDESQIDEVISNEMQFIQESISAIRNLRKQVDVAPSHKVSILIHVQSQEDIQLMNKYSHYFEKLANVSSLEVATDLEKPETSIAAVVKNATIYLPLQGLLDIEKEVAKLEKQKGKLANELAGIERKLKNEKFLANAPEEIVQKEKEKYEEVKTKLDKIEEIIFGFQKEETKNE